jgi:hypothetical protein
MQLRRRAFDERPSAIGQAIGQQSLEVGSERLVQGRPEGGHVGEVEHRSFLSGIKNAPKAESLDAVSGGL